ncbi:hypothetical protein I317_00360 [Kwoniella heveanensis CBS 569]|nr:hypothetical protein I317_00360 [Kwoniella heveanensis CBS 569]
MSVVASPLVHQPFSDTELYAHSGSVSAHAELPPPLPAPISGTSPTQQTVPFPVFQHRHTSPYPTPHSFSALGPPPPSEITMNVLGSLSAPAAPKGSPVSLPAVSPDIQPQPQIILPPTPDPSPPASKVLSPTMMVKLAPPADDSPYSFTVVEHRSPSIASTSSIQSADTTPRRLPVISVDTSAASSSAVIETPPQRLRSQSSLEVIPVSAPAKVSSERKPSRPKSMGPPPRPRRSQTAYPAPTSVKMVESRSADSRAKLRAHVPAMPRNASYGPKGSPGLVRAFSDASNTPPRSGAFHLNNADMAPPDLGGPDGLEAKVVLLGSQGVGKTSLILRYTTRNFSPTPAPATIGSSLHARKLVHDGVRVKLQIWDTAGQERFRSMAPIYYRGAHVCVLVYDISDRQSFEDVRSWLDELGRTVPKETVIFVVGAKIDLERKRAVTIEEARTAIKTWLKPPPTPEPPVLLSPPPRSLFRTSTSISRTGSNTGASGPPSRSQSFGALSSLGVNTSGSAPPAPVPAPRPADVSRVPSQGVPFPISKPSSIKSREKPAPTKLKSSSPPSVRFLSPTSPSKLSFSALQSPTKPTSATFTDPVGPSITSASAMSGHGTSGGRFSISGVLGLSRTTSMGGAASSLAQLAEAPTSPRLSTESSSGSRTAYASAGTPVRTRVESSPLLSDYHPRADRRRSEDWSSRSWKMGEGPSAAEALGEFGEGIKRKQSGEMLAPLSASTGSAFMKQQKPITGRSRGGSLGRDPRLHGEVGRGDDDIEADGMWGIEVEGVRLGECSALSGQGVEALFKSITSILVERKDKIERDRVLRRKNSVMLTDPKDGKTDSEGKGRNNYGCCA